ncbi:MAG TPA: alanine dehydrogenase [Saprospiraceae bacterium]|nr:alanine dehydrogenase [Saprospiraceae bacterium]
MGDQKGMVDIPKHILEEHLKTQPEQLLVKKRQGKYAIGVPNEITFQENRVALVPHSVATLVAIGYRVIVESGAGKKSKISDSAYADAGADVVFSAEAVYKADVIIKVTPPSIKEIEYFRPNQILISPLHIPVINAEYINKLKQKRVIAIAMEYLHNDKGVFPVVRVMSEISGIFAMHTAAELLTNFHNGNGILLGGIAGVPPAKVVILGAGVVAEFATRTALGLGAEVRIFDDSIEKLVRLQNNIGKQLFTSVLDPISLKKQLLEADVAIGALHSNSGRAPMVVNEDLVTQMKSGSVIVDVSIDQGGCFETSEVTTHKNPTFIKHEVIHYCVPNIPSMVSQTASVAISNILTSIMKRAKDSGGLEQMLFTDVGLRNGVYTFKGSLTNDYLGRRFGIKTINLDLLLTSGY